MERNTKQVIRRKKQLNVLRFLLVLLMAALLAFYGHIIYALSLLLVFYLAREAYGCDHIFYSVKSDYTHNLSPHWSASINGVRAINGTTIPPSVDTLLLAVKIKNCLSGYVRDPFVEITGINFSYRQYFERGAQGLRYINLTQLLQGEDKNAALVFHHCTAEAKSQLLGFANPHLAGGAKIMVVAPHADDAELAAFGVYASHHTMIVTLTAGETEAEDFLVTELDLAKASQHKGELRSQDSLGAGTLGGVPAERIVSLGYFCKQLKAMYNQPDKEFSSLSASISDPRFFRRHNRRILASDVHGNSTWNSLVGDLRELLADFQPDVIVTPHPRLDPHPDHHYGSRAVLEALQGQALAPVFLLYANHYHNTQQAPFGPAHSAVGLPPQHVIAAPPLGVYTHVLDMTAQIKKVAALQLMHDLQRKVSWTRRLRPRIQSWLAGRPENTYGRDDFFRKAVRCHEVFLVTDRDGLGRLLE